MARSTLQLPVHCGGLALPNLLIYYWAAVLVTVRWWFEQSRSNAATCLEAAIIGSFTELGNIAYRGPSAYSLLPGPTRMTLKVWAVARKRFLCPCQYSPFTPLWGNPSLPHFKTIPDPQLWARFGIKVLKDIIHSGALLLFQELAEKFGLPSRMIFRYYQLRHAARAQFTNPIHLKPDPIEETLAQEILKKTLSTLYLALLETDSPKMHSLWAKWQADIPSLNRETWEECFEDGSKLMVSSRDRLLHTKFLHRVYYTPQRLHQIYPNRSPNCNRCQSPDSTYLHIFWTCPLLVKYWTAIFESINIRLQLTLPVSPELALLGIHDDDQRPKYTKILISLLLFYAKKEILKVGVTVFPQGGGVGLYYQCCVTFYIR